MFKQVKFADQFIVCQINTLDENDENKEEVIEMAKSGGDIAVALMLEFKDYKRK